ncbi:glycosyltransferase family 25 protein [Sclerotinia borealis F-4128]|uniref:Glycosyltransferase family 25 protein n=1 Tax=Sclerotinia borealis (strain F-4128) TaxID=1432307 RepID=W9CJN4_SCLBF|nr:glycosyltransferase family 25 protein [Sclerotinia borealis F-4128]
MITSSSRPYILGACFALTLIIFLSLSTRTETSSTSSTSSTWLDYSDKSRMSPDYQSKPNYLSATSDKKLRPADTTSEIGRASNGTLGFEEVFVIGLRERSDKRDAMVLSASLTGFEVEFVDGMKGDEISDKARPPGLALKDGAIGSWRGHMNVIRRIVENKLASAFIMEDDVDWDIRLLTQLPEYAKGIRTLSHIPLSTRQHSPYGDDWDVLWPGHCGDELPPTSNKNTKDELYIIPNDPTVAPKSAQSSLKLLADYPEKTRIVHKAGAPICTFGYGVSYRGAQKILMALAVKGGADLAVDNAIAFLCRDGYLDMKCYSVEPQLFQHHRPAGAMNKDSDINSFGDGDAKGTREKGVTDMIVWSARLNLEKLIMGKEDYDVQW